MKDTFGATEMPNPFPWFKFSPSDWLTSVSLRLMTIAEEGAYHRLLCEEWEQPDCGLPDDDRALSVLSRLGQDWDKSRTVIRQQFELRGDRLFNLRLLEEREKAVKVLESQIQAATDTNAKRTAKRNGWRDAKRAVRERSLHETVSESVSSSVVTTEKQQTAEVRPDLDVWASGIYARWKKYRDRPLAEQALCGPNFNREQFEATYDKWLDYHERAGWQYAPTLAAFLFDRTYEHEPPAATPRRKSAADEAFEQAMAKIEREEG